MPRESLPVLLVPGLMCSPRLYAAQMPMLWERGPVTVADHRRDDTIAGIATHILATAPPRFALVGLSMGGYIALELMRQAPARVERLALLDTSARPETPRQSEMRRERIALAEAGRFAEVPALSFPIAVHPSRRDDEVLRSVVAAMARDTGAEAFVRQQRAIMGRPDSRPTLGAIACRTLVLVGDADVVTPPDEAAEMAQTIPRARQVVVPACGHLSSLERPQAVTEALGAWLDD